MHSGGIWNDLELQRKNENNVSKVFMLVVSETIWNCREIDENNVSKACIVTVLETI